MKGTQYILFMKQWADRAAIKEEWIAEAIDHPSETAISLFRKKMKAKRPFGRKMGGVSYGNLITLYG